MKLCYITTLSISIKAFFIPQLKYFAENGIDVTVICSPDESLQELLGSNIRYIPVPIPRGIDVWGSFKAIASLKKIFKRERFDFIQYSTPNAAFYASIAAKSAKTKVRNYHLMGIRYLGSRGLKRKILYWLERIACKNSTHVECVSHSNLVLAENEKLFPKGKGVVVWNGSSGGIDIRRFDFAKREAYRDEIREKYSIGKDEFVFGFVGRITKDKGINELLEAFFNFGDAKLMIVGNDENVGTLDSELYERSLSDERIIYTGQVSDICKYYAAMDVLVFPSFREGFGNVVIEAAAMGTPAIISNIPGPIDAVKADETALIVPAHNSEELRIAMEKMTDNDFRARLAVNAVEFVRESFDDDVLIRHILNRKNELIGRTSP